MSNRDYSNGMAAGSAAAVAAAKRAQNTAGRWQEFSGRLETKLVNEEVERSVTIAYAKALRDALKQVAPSHPLLNSTEAEKFLNNARAQAFAEKGFDYNQVTNQVSPRR
ncbi:hypothetical protein [Herbaspirillum sp. YR522]|uniref:hypothetical protein n=1 Tax=Herbaspirillum sp. YR522 TaxID=1144342 RepID=UPI0012F85709|nr:hypothetical protein [Herbaspirillum sp. YR522]